MPPRSARALSCSAPAPLGDLTALPRLCLPSWSPGGGTDWRAIDPLPSPQMGGHIPEATSEEIAEHGALCPASPPRDHPDPLLSQVAVQSVTSVSAGSEGRSCSCPLLYCGMFLRAAL